MANVLNKVRLLERYIELCNDQTSEIVGRTVDKLLEREQEQIHQTLELLKARLAAFERRYNMPSEEFYPRFERGELGDGMDLIEWSATWEMIAQAQQAIETLQGETVAA